MVKRIAILALLVAGLHAARADDSVPKYKPGQPQRYATIAAADSAAISLVTSLVDCGYNQVIRVDCKFSSASATLKIHFVRTDGFQVSMTTATATADATYTLNNKYVADSLAFDSGSWRYFKLVVEAPSAGTVDVDVTICGGQ